MSLVKFPPQAKDVMTTDPVCAEASTSIRALARIFEEHEISGAPVVDAEGKLIGVVSKADLIRRCAEGTDDIPPAYLFEILGEHGDDEETSEVIPEALICVEDFMTVDPVTVSPEESVSSIARIMSERRIHRVIVVDPCGFPIGIVTCIDVLGVFPR